MTDQTQIIETAVIERLSHVIDPELGRSVTDLGMICGVDVRPTGLDSFNVRVNVELTVPGLPAVCRDQQADRGGRDQLCRGAAHRRDRRRRDG